MQGIKVLYAGKAMTMWETSEEAEASWHARSELDLLTRTTFPFWRADRVEVVEKPQDMT